jgi:hypothetical protein
MSPSELSKFEQLRRENADVDQLVVEQQMFLQQLEHYGEREITNTSFTSYIINCLRQAISKKLPRRRWRNCNSTLEKI